LKEKYEKNLGGSKAHHQVERYKTSKWDFTTKDMPRLREQLEFYLKLDELHQQMRNFLDETKEEVINISHIVKENKISSSLPNRTLQSLGVNNNTLVFMDTDTCKVKLRKWRTLDKKAKAAESRITTFMDNMTYMWLCGLPSSWDDSFIFHSLEQCDEITRTIK